jgi:primosomal protein N' (replication factor Y) (superfamily II helicase)
LLELTKEQRNILNQIQSDIKFNNEERILLRGITGSGKTLIYMKLIEDAVSKGKMALYLLPEIALTPQLYDRFETAFPGKVCTIHSRLSKNERFELYLRILSGEFSIVIGARSAIFSPIKNAGLIIVDEEHDKSFKQDSPAPRYNARDCSIILSKIYSCPVILGSATPSLESYFNVVKRNFKLYELKNRFRSDITLPHVYLVDLIDAQRNSRIQNHITFEINEEINNCLKKGRGIIIFLNRRGFANYLQCKECGFIPECPHCSVRLTYHEKINKLVCHYCSHSEGLHSVCNNCSGLEFDKIGTGIQKVEKDIVDSFFNYKVERFDSDSAGKIEMQRNILQNFKNGNTQILIGTQMLSKGIDLDNVGMVVIVNADLELFLNDFRASERTYQLLNQVAGRAGRGVGERAKVFVQSSHTEHPAIKSLLDNDVKNYLKNELKNREELNYPPFSRLIKIEISSKDLSKSYKSANALYDMIPKNMDFIEANPPVQPTISKVKQEHRFVILIKNIKVNDKNGEKCRKVLRGVMDYYYKSFPVLNPKVIVDVDANSLI